MNNILDPGFALTLRPMQYPQFYEMYKDSVKNTWTVEEVDFSTDLVDLRTKMSPADTHLIQRLVTFFATGDTIVSNNLILNLYKHINSPEARMFLSRQLYEEALHIQFYLTLLDTYIPNQEERSKAFAAVDNIPSIKQKADFCFKWIDSISDLTVLNSREDRRRFLLNLICFAACIEGLFFFAAFAYVYFLRSKGLLNGLASGTNWVFRDESCLPLSDTDILTDTGFQNLGKVIASQSKAPIKVAQYSRLGKVTYVVPRAVVINDSTKDLVRLTGPGISLTTTLDHDNVITSKVDGKLSKLKAIDIEPSLLTQLPCAGFADGEKEVLSDMDKLLLILALYGYERKAQDTVTLAFVSPSDTLPPVAEEFNELLLKAHIERTYRVADNTWSNGVPEHAKKIHVFTIKRSALADFTPFDALDWIDLTTISGTWGRECIRYLQKISMHPGLQSPRSYVEVRILEATDKLQAVAAISNMSSSLVEITGSDWYRINFVPKNSVDLNGVHKEVIPASMATYKQVGCVNVPDGMIIVRQNGVVHVTGNCHMNFAFSVIDTVKSEEPDLFDVNLQEQIYQMLEEAIVCEHQFAEDVLKMGVNGLSSEMMLQYLRYSADQRFVRLGMEKKYNVRNPLDFMELQDIQELANFFERRVSAYQAATEGVVEFDASF